VFDMQRTHDSAVSGTSSAGLCAARFFWSGGPDSVLSAAWCSSPGSESLVAFMTHAHRLVMCDVREPTRALLTDTVVGGRGHSVVWPTPNQAAGMAVFACDDAVIRSYSTVEMVRCPTKGTHVWNIDWSPLGLPLAFAAGLNDGTALVMRPPKKGKQREKFKRVLAVCGVGRQPELSGEGASALTDAQGVDDELQLWRASVAQPDAPLDAAAYRQQHRNARFVAVQCVAWSRSIEAKHWLLCATASGIARLICVPTTLAGR